MPRLPKPDRAVMTLRVNQALMDEFDRTRGGRDRTACIEDAMTAWVFVQKGMSNGPGRAEPSATTGSPVRPVPEDALERMIADAGELYCDHVPRDGICVECGEVVA